jgi:DNA-binding response OmpR family regulator
MSTAASRIVVVDDDPSIRRLIELILLRAGYRLSLVGSAPEALAAIAAEPTDLVITDLMMPDMSGLDLLRVLRADAGQADVPVIVLTAVGQPSQVEAARDLGAFGCVFKPFGQAYFLATVRAALGQHDAAG